LETVPPALKEYGGQSTQALLGSSDRRNNEEIDLDVGAVPNREGGF